MIAHTDAPSGAHVAVVRAIPMPGHKRRWAGLERWIPDPAARPQQEMQELPTGGLRPKFDAAGKPVWAKHALPWPDTEVKVLVVDEPRPFDPNANGGVPVEISPATLAMLSEDPRISVRFTGDGGNSDEVIAAKARAAELEQKLEEAQRALATEQERAAKYQRDTTEAMKRQAERTNELEAQLRQQSALLQSAPKPKK